MFPGKSIYRALTPSLILLILGLGNFGVGSYKKAEYEAVLRELSISEPVSAGLNLTPLQRIQLVEQSATRQMRRQAKAKARHDFYNLEVFGGKIFIALSVFWFFLTSVRTGGYRTHSH